LVVIYLSNKRYKKYLLVVILGSRMRSKKL